MVDAAFSEFQFGQDDDELTLGESKLELKKGDRIRVSFLRWGTQVVNGKTTWDLTVPSPVFVIAKVHYVKGVGAVIDQGPEYSKLIGKEPTTKIGTVIVSWPLDRMGAVDKDLLNLGKYDVYPWIFSPNKYQDLIRKHRNRPFNSHDLILECKDTKYQAYDYDTCNESILKILLEKDSKLVEDLMKKSDIVFNKMKQMIGSVISIKDLKEKLAESRQGSGSATSFDVVSSDIGDVFDKEIG